jgi:DnaA family protein
MIPRQLILNIQPEAEPRFDNFVPGDNWEALARLHDAALGKAGEVILYCWGDTGCGASHLLRATVAEARGQGRAAAYYRADQTLPEDLAGLLAVDDVERLDAEGQVRLFSLINQAKDGAGRVIAAGAAAPAHLDLRADLRTRLAWGLVFRLAPLSEADRSAAVRERALARGLDLSGEVVSYLLTHSRRDLPSLLTTVDALDSYSLSLKRPVTVALLRELLSNKAT